MSPVSISRRRFLAGAGYGVLAAGLAACGSSVSPSPSTASPSSTANGSANPSPGASLASPSPGGTGSPSPSGSDEAALRRKIASLLVVGFRGQQVTSSDWIQRAVAARLGGVILFDRDQLTGTRRNIASPAQVRALIHTLRNASPSLIVSIDQEGGRVARLNPADGFPTTRSEASIGATDDPDVARAWGRAIADSLASIGVTLNLAPVVDMNVNPSNPAIGALDRSFSAKADVVVSMATQEIAAHHAAGIRTSLKHFPGFGSATGNTDFGVVDVSTSWHPTELEPFRRLVTAGIVDSVLVAHLLNRQLDRSLPASLSPAVVTDLLRNQLGWAGPVVSDDMQATAITTRYGRSDAVALALEAGVDLLVFANQQTYDETVVTGVVDGVVELVRSGRISEARIDESVARIATVRSPPA